MNPFEASSARRLDRLAENDAFVERLAASLIADPGAAADVAQDARFAAWRSPPGNPESARGYLTKIVARFASNRRRSVLRRVRHEQLAARPESSSAERVAEREEARQRLWEAVESLEAPLRDVVRLRFFDGRPPREVAEEAGVPVETIYARQKRALERLREILDRRHGGRDAWIAMLLPLGRMEITAVGALIGGGTLMVMKATVIVAATLGLIALAWWGSRPGESPPDARPAAAHAPSSFGAVAASRPTESGPVASSISSAPFIDPDADRASFVLVRERGRTPAADAEAAIVRPGGSLERGRTDASGTVRFKASAGRGQLVVRTSSRPTTIFAVPLHAGTTELVLAEGLTLRGRVTVDGKPPGRPIALSLGDLAPAGIPIAPTLAARDAFLAGSSPQSFGFPVVTADDGSFNVEGVLATAAGRVEIQCDEDRLELDPTRVDPESGSFQRIRLPLSSDLGVIPLLTRHLLKGRIRSDDGGPPPGGAFVIVLAMAACPGGGMGRATAPIATDPDGAFATPLPFGLDYLGVASLSIQAHAGPGAPPTVFEFPSSPPGALDVGDLRLPPRRQVRCAVRGTDGDPMRGVAVSDIVRDGASTEAVTDEAGVARLDLPLGPRVLRATADGFNVAYAAVPEGASYVDMTISAAGRLEVHVFAADGSPAPMTPFVLRRPWHEPPGPPERRGLEQNAETGWEGTNAPDLGAPAGDVETSATTNSAGVFAMRGLEAGDSVEITILAYGPPRRVRLSKSTTLVEFRMPSDAPEFAVKVQGPDGGAVANVGVSFSSEPGVQAAYAPCPDHDGVHRIRYVDWTRAVAEVWAGPDFERAQIELTPNHGAAPAVIRLRPARSLRLRVTDDAGDPFPGASVAIAPGENAPGQVERMGPSEFVLRGISGRLPELSVGFSGFGMTMTPDAKGDEARLVLPSTGYCEFLWNPADPSGPTPIVGMNSDDDARRWFGGEMRRGADGKFRFRVRAPVGRYVVDTESLGAKPAAGSSVVVIRRNETTTYDLGP